jgi:hypothetical protein
MVDMDDRLRAMMSDAVDPAFNVFSPERDAARRKDSSASSGFGSPLARIPTLFRRRPTTTTTTNEPRGLGYGATGNSGDLELGAIRGAATPIDDDDHGGDEGDTGETTTQVDVHPPATPSRFNVRFRAREETVGFDDDFVARPRPSTSTSKSSTPAHRIPPPPPTVTLTSPVDSDSGSDAEI